MLISEINDKGFDQDPSMKNIHGKLDNFEGFRNIGFDQYFGEQIEENGINIQGSAKFGAGIE
jgi:hypothetical protein